MEKKRVLPEGSKGKCYRDLRTERSPVTYRFQERLYSTIS